MSEQKQTRVSLSGAILILSFAIIFSSYVISGAIREASNNNEHSQYLYHLERFNSNFEEYLSILENNNN